MLTSNFDTIPKKLALYKKKYYSNSLLRGVIFFMAVVFTAWPFFSSLEYFGRFNSAVRFSLLLSFSVLAGFTLYKWIILPILQLTRLNKQLSDEEAAVQIGKFFPQVSDKLLNALQLKKLSSQENELLIASINQKSAELSVIPFTEAVKLEENKKHLKYIVLPIALILVLFQFAPGLLTEGMTRIVKYNIEFVPKAPFEFVINNASLQAYKNEDFELSLQLNGASVPDHVFLISNGKRSKMTKQENGSFSHTYKSVQRNETFFFEAAGFASGNTLLNVISRPDLKSFETEVAYPPYLGKRNETLKNAGNLTVPEGTNITWLFTTADAEKIALLFLSDSTPVSLNIANNRGIFTKKMRATESYSIRLENGQFKSKEAIVYTVNVLKDQFPSIQIERYNDTVLYSFISIGGKIEDDYGLNALRLFYRIKTNANETVGTFKSIPIAIDTKSAAQNFYYNWKIDSLSIKPDETLEYYLQVWDNDGVNGSKSSKSASIEFKFPSDKELEKDLNESSNKAENSMEAMLDKTMQLQKEINRLQQKMKTQKNLSWQEKKALDDVLKKHEQLRKELEQLAKENKQLSEKVDKFSPQEEETAMKMQALQNLFNELLDEETKKMYDELQKLLNDKASKEMIEKALEQMAKKDEALNQELDRALEMFKQLKFEQKLNEAIKDLTKLADKQEKLSEKSNDKTQKAEDLAKEQKELNEAFKDIKEELKELKDLNESLENKNAMEETAQGEKSIEQEQQESKEGLENNQKSKAAKAQKNAAEKMQQMSDKLSKMQESSAMEQAEENLEDLRAILDNLLTLSFDQEALMKDFKKVSQSDPRYIQLAQKQLKFKDDSKVIEDSLMALAKRVFQIQSFVTREVRLMKGYMDESVDGIKARRVDLVAGKQQFAMTSMNNLALMLNDVMKQMQEQMAQQKNSKGDSQCKKPGTNKKPGLGEMQKALNQGIEKLKKSGMSGRELSEELAKLAAQQEMIRKALREMEGKMGKDGKTPGSQLSEMKKLMEQTEKDLVNKKITQETLLRQQDILSKLLESEKAARERELDDKREAEKARDVINELPPSFEKYLKSKERQVDLLKTVPPSLNPYYKQEVNEYFQKLEN